MASSLISGAVVLLLILTGGYVIAAGILTIAESTMNSQTDMSNIQDGIRQSSIHIDSSAVGYTTVVPNSGWWVVIELNNTGSTSYGKADFVKAEIFIYQNTGTKSLNRYPDITKSPVSSTITSDTDIINRNMWDPSETLRIGINTSSVIPNWTKIVMPNGITASSNL